MKKRYIIAASIISVLLVASASAYTYYVWRDDLPTFSAPSYGTIVPPDSSLRGVPGVYADCGFSPSPCVGSIPEPSTYALFGLGLGILIWRVKCGRLENKF